MHSIVYRERTQSGTGLLRGQENDAQGLGKHGPPHGGRAPTHTYVQPHRN